MDPESPLSRRTLWTALFYATLFAGLSWLVMAIAGGYYLDTIEDEKELEYAQRAWPLYTLFLSCITGAFGLSLGCRIAMDKEETEAEQEGEVEAGGEYDIMNEKKPASVPEPCLAQLLLGFVIGAFLGGVLAWITHAAAHLPMMLHSYGFISEQSVDPKFFIPYILSGGFLGMAVAGWSRLGHLNEPSE